jgi:hypothetical protein
MLLVELLRHGGEIAPCRVVLLSRHPFGFLLQGFANLPDLFAFLDTGAPRYSADRFPIRF